MKKYVVKCCNKKCDDEIVIKESFKGKLKKLKRDKTQNVTKLKEIPLLCRVHVYLNVEDTGLSGHWATRWRVKTHSCSETINVTKLKNQNFEKKTTTKLILQQTI